MDFTVIMPCYNAADSIARALHSCAEQTLPPAEIIVIDDGSSDDSIRAAETCGVDVTVLRGERGGAAAARNMGIERTSTPYIAFLDADDRWLPDHLEEAARVLSGAPDDVGYFSLRYHVYADGRREPMQNAWGIESARSGITHTEWLRMFSKRPLFSMPTTAVRTDRIREIGALDAAQTRRHDIEMWMRLIHEHTWSFNPARTGEYTSDSPGSISRTNWASTEYFHALALAKNLERYDSPEFRGLLSRWSRRAMACAITDGSREDRVRARDLTMRHLSPRDRLMFRVGLLVPGLFRAMHKSKRRAAGMDGDPLAKSRAAAQG